MNILNSLRIGVVAVVVLMIGLEPAQTAPGDPLISQTPLSQATRVPPNIMFILDDSGSMEWDFMPGAFNSGQVPKTSTSEIQLQAYDRNTLYYNPHITYRPWRKADGSYFPDTPATAVYRSNAHASGSTTDLTNDDRVFHVLKPAQTDVSEARNYYRYILEEDGGASRCQLRSTVLGWRWEDCTSVSSFSWTAANGTTTTRTLAQEWQNFANWYSYHRTRSKVAKAGASYAFADVGKDNRVGFETIWHLYNGRDSGLDIPVTKNGGLFEDVTGASNRSDWFDKLFNARANDGTPLRPALNKAGQYFSRTDANGPWGGTESEQLTCRQNFAILTTDGYWNTGDVSGVGNSDNADGPQYTSSKGTAGQYVASRPFMDGHSTTLADIAMHFWKNDLRPTMSNNVPTSGADPAFWQHMTTFGISIGLQGTLNPKTDLPALTSGAKSWPNPMDDEDSERIDDLFHASVNGHGSFVAATNPEEFTAGLKAALAAIGDITTLSGTFSGSGARVPGGALALTIEPSYASMNNGRDWVGDIVASAVNADGTAGDQRWSASTRLALKDPASRRVYAAMASGANSTAGGALSVSTFQAANLGADDDARKAKVGANFTHTPLDYPLASIDEIVAYLRGDTSREARNGGPFRNRTSVLGDIVNSSPVISVPADNYGYLSALPTDSLLSGYEDYLEEKSAREPVIYVGANDGMFHAFNAETGDEQFAYIPNRVLGNLGQLPRQEYAHRYYVDGSPVVMDAKYNSSWHTVVVGTTAAGGRSVFALNVDDPGSFDASDVLWEFTDGTGKGHDADLGATFSKPIVVPLENDEWGVIFGNGYSNDSNDAALYIVRLSNGELIRKIKPVDGNTTYNGLGQIAVVDNDGDGRADMVYGGDLQGHIWKFDISASDSNGWGVALDGKPLFTATSTLNVPQPITGALEVTIGPGGGYTILFGTGRYFAVNDNLISGTPRIESLYGVWDPMTGASELTRNNLTAQFITGQSTVMVDDDGDPDTPAVARETRTTSTNVLSPTGQFGFVIDLALSSGSAPTYTATGEFFVGTPRVQNGKIFFTTFEPTGGSNPCDPGGRNWIYALNVVNGAAAMQNVRLNGAGDLVCTGNCGAVAISEADTPVTETSMFIPKITQCDPTDPTCDLKKMLELQLQQCTLVIRAAGSPPLILPRPCGRQSWRQVQ